MSTRRNTRPIITLICVALGVVVLDQLTKAWAVAQLRPRLFPGGEGPIEIIGSLLRLTYTENTGAAFSMGNGFTWVFSIVALVVVIVIIRSARELGSVLWAIALGGLLGGALGNLIDRLTREPGFGQGYVVDFIQLPNFPVFNVADMSLTLSAVLMVVLALKGVDYRGAAAGSP
ncbi:MAG: signal peptidase II [Actinomycetota bacterium]|nr:signal peptidase II [Actinomycetota bacterium]MDP2288986.1 signal peptidase II [Actinomycetota bacterium]